MRLRSAHDYLGQRASRTDTWRHGWRLVLLAFARHRLAAPGAALTVDDVFAAGWPGERCLPDAAVARVYAVLATLRRMGLAECLQTRDDGYLIPPSLPLRLTG